MNQNVYRPRNRKLSPQQAREIRARALAGSASRELAVEFGVNSTTILDIIHGTHHVSRVTARLTDDTYVKLETAAQAAGVTPEEHAAHVITKAVSR